MLDAVSNKINFPGMEEDILAYWEEQDTFKKSLEQRRGGTEYVFYDGPPFATGLPHYGHLLAGTIKDIVPRYQAMRGHYVARRFGWDCHGLPIEALAQEKLGLAGTGAIVEKGVDVFNETCRSMVTMYVEEWRKTVTRMGRWVDFDNDYKTMDVNFMESIWWVFSRLWEQGRIYKSYRIMPYSWKLTTPLSNFEAGRNYQDVQDPSITVRVRLTVCDEELAAMGDCYALIWTTTPWTLPGNLAICAGPDIDYVAVRDKAEDVIYVLAEARLGAYYKDEDACAVLKRFKGRDLADWTYEPLFDYFKDQPRAFRVLLGDFVSTADGSGIVHMAPAYGEDDFATCTAAGIELVDPLNADCVFTDQAPDYAGQFCKDADRQIIRRLKDEKKLIHQSTIVHSYPFCDRTDTPLIYRAIDAWYVRVEDLRDRLAENNSKVHWVPDYVGGKRFENWLREAKDWNISRNRFWGSCIPVWAAEDGSDMVCVGSIRELEELSGVKVTDLHKHIIDKITFKKDGKTYRRTPEVLDCWFESGSMPYAQQHYPFERKDELDSFFPAHFIAEGLDQTRGWFYTLLVLSTALFDTSAFKNVVVNGLVLAEDGKKMSKRLKNYPDPMYMLHEYGADALRLYMINSPVVRAEDLCFSEDGVKHSLRHFLIPWWNAYSFFVTYARIDEWTPDKMSGAPSANLLDQWIQSSLEHLNQDVVEAMDGYDLQRAVRPFVHFLEDLTNWYIRRSRRRFWKSTDDADKMQAYETLYRVLLRLSKIAAPFVPFMSEAIYRNLRTEDMPESVHLCDFPVADGAGRDAALEARMRAVMEAVSMARQIRADHNLKVRQPLAGMHVVCRDRDLLAQIESLRDIIADELNVKNVTFSDHEVDLVHLKAKANFRNLGPRFGKNVKQAAAAIQQLPDNDIETLLEGGRCEVEVDGQVYSLEADDIVVERQPRENLAVSSQDNLVVALDVALDDDLIEEGLAREFVNKVQNIRKNMELEVTDRILITFTGVTVVEEAVFAHRSYIENETLCVELCFTEDLPDDAEEIDLNGHPCHVTISKSTG
ncbi:MAG: isoleucine--tRNA ligase [Spartobacteria bacterium]|nr:isoleucine--tRNA ligase [Spartobacteria bacterium]